MPQWGWWIVGGGITIGLVSPHPFLSLAGWLLLPVLVRLTWRAGESPIPTVGVLMLWISAMLPVIFFSGFKGIPLDQVANTYTTRFSTEMLGPASWLSLAATLMVALGIRLGLSRLPPIPWQRFWAEAQRLDPEKLILAYGGAYALNFFFGGAALLGLGGIAQFTIALTSIRWAFFFLLVVTVLVQRRQYSLLVLAITIEITFGLLGFWGSFKDFFFVFAVAYVAARPRMSTQEVRGLLLMLLLVLTLGLFWQSVKNDFRDYVTQGETSMQSQVTFAEEVEKMRMLIRETEPSDLIDATDITVERISVKTFFFGEVLEYIPEYRAYDGGAGWRAGLEHIFKPRLFFPDKPSLDASAITNRYIARTVTGEGAASFAIGYFGESYADFGPIGMFIPIFLVGLGLGLMYRFFLRHPPIKIMGIAFASAFLLARIGGLHDIPQMLGRTITEFVAMAAVLYFFGPIIYKYIRR